jgi:hypothetical protein
MAGRSGGETVDAETIRQHRECSGCIELCTIKSFSTVKLTISVLSLLLPNLRYLTPPPLSHAIIMVAFRHRRRRPAACVIVAMDAGVSTRETRSVPLKRSPLTWRCSRRRSCCTDCCCCCGCCFIFATADVATAADVAPAVAHKAILVLLLPFAEDLFLLSLWKAGPAVTHEDQVENVTDLFPRQSLAPVPLPPSRAGRSTSPRAFGGTLSDLIAVTLVKSWTIFNSGQTYQTHRRDVSQSG